jgi:flagellar biosynthesis/type III secretory pathway ATPase
VALAREWLLLEQMSELVLELVLGWALKQALEKVQD